MLQTEVISERRVTHQSRRALWVEVLPLRFRVPWLASLRNAVALRHLRGSAARARDDEAAGQDDGSDDAEKRDQDRASEVPSETHCESFRY